MVKLFAIAVLWTASCAGAVFETGDLRLEIAPDGRLRSLASRPEGVEYAGADPSPVAAVFRGGRLVCTAEGPHAAVIGRWVYEGGQRLVASRVDQQGNQLRIGFGRDQVRATYRVRTTNRYLAFELLRLEGEPVDRIEFLHLAVRRLPFLGQWAGAVYDDRFGVCLCGGNPRTNIEMLPGEKTVHVTAAAEAAVGMPGATAVLFGCARPKHTFLNRMAEVERAFGLPAGAEFRRSSVQRMSYLWASRPTPDNIHHYIAGAKQGGFRMILISYTAFSIGPGHFAWNDRYPNGMSDLRRVTDAIRAAGLRLGLHIHYSKVGKKDAYVTPVPDERLHSVRKFTLSRGVTAEASVLPVVEDPAGCTLDAGRRLLKLGKELIEYEAYQTQPPYQFTGCRRASLGTTASARAAQTELSLLDVDTWPAFIRIDQRTDLQDEIAGRIAEIYRQSGPYEMVYFDGAEDVHEPFWYHSAAAQYRVFRRLEPSPPVCEAAHYTHFSWHMISRSNAYDTVAPPDGMKDFCRLMPCPTAAARALDFSRIDFGWLGNFGRSKQGAAGPDVFEYIASRAAGWDCPISLHATVEHLQSNPRADDCLAAIRTWEDARLGDRLSEADRRRLAGVAPADARYVPCFEQRGIYENSRQNRGLTDSQRRLLADRREHHLLIDEQGRNELVELEELGDLAGRTVKACLFQRAAHSVDTYVLAWAAKGRVRLRVPHTGLVAMRGLGNPLALKVDGNACEVEIGPRTYLLLRNAAPDSVRRLLRQAEIVPGPPKP